MNIEMIHIILIVIMVTAALYMICIFAFTYGIITLKETYERCSIHDIKVSILVAAKNEENVIITLLKSFINQTYSKDMFEIILIDDHSTDNTHKLAEDFIKEHSELNIRLLTATGQGKKAAISQALHSASNDLIMVTDADCDLPETWIESFVARYKHQDVKMILGPVLLSPANNIFEKLQVIEHLSLIASTAGSASIKMPVMCNGANMAYERKAAIEVERYRHDMNIVSGDDIFLLEQFLRHYGNNSVCFLLDKAAVVKTKTSPTISHFLKQRRRWVSKTKAYTNIKIIVTALTVLLFNLGIVSLSIMAIITPLLWLNFVMFVLLKFLIDFPILRYISNFMNQRSLIFWVLPLEFIYPYYVVITAISGLILKTRWK